MMPLLPLLTLFRCGLPACFVFLSFLGGRKREHARVSDRQFGASRRHPRLRGREARSGGRVERPYSVRAPRRTARRMRKRETTGRPKRDDATTSPRQSCSPSDDTPRNRQTQREQNTDALPRPRRREGGRGRGELIFRDDCAYSAAREREVLAHPTELTGLPRAAPSSAGLI